MRRQEVDAWLSARRPLRPGALELRMARAVAELPGDVLEDTVSMARALGVIGLRLLREATMRAPQAPELAMDILAADAFVTYAVEAAAEDGEALEVLAGELIMEAAA